MKTLLSLLAFVALSACVTVPNTTACTAAGSLRAGAICAETLTGKKTRLTMDQYLDFLEVQIEPPRAGAICQSADDWNRQKTALEQACRQLGKRCSYEVKRTLQVMEAFGAHFRRP